MAGVRDGEFFKHYNPITSMNGAQGVGLRPRSWLGVDLNRKVRPSKSLVGPIGSVSDYSH